MDSWIKFMILMTTCGLVLSSRLPFSTDLFLIGVPPPTPKNDQNILVKPLDSGDKPGPAFDVRIFNLDFFPIHINFTFDEIIPEDKVSDMYDVYEFKSGRSVGRYRKEHRFFFDMAIWSMFRWKIFPAEDDVVTENEIQ